MQFIARTAVVLLMLSTVAAQQAEAQVLERLRIDGPDEVTERGTAQYRVYAVFDDGREFDVTLFSTLSLDPGLYASLDPFGTLTAQDVESPQAESVVAEFRWDGERHRAGKVVTIKPSVMALVMERVLPCGRIYLSIRLQQGQRDGTRVFNRRGEQLGILLEGQLDEAPGMHAFDLNGWLYVGQWNDDRVLAVDTSGKLRRTLSGNGLNGVTGTVLTPDGGLAVCSYLSDSLRFFDRNGSYLRNFGHSGTEDPHSLAYDRQGFLYVCGARNNGNGRIAVFDPQLNFVRFIGEGRFNDPHEGDLSVAFDRSEAIYAASRENVYKFDRDGNYLLTISHSLMKDPAGSAFDENERLYVTDHYVREIFVFEPDGSFVERFSLQFEPQLPEGAVVWSIAFEPGAAEDCNSNGAADSCDVYEETSPDCNANRVPDECDISSGTSQDADGNGVPDECEGCSLIERLKLRCRSGKLTAKVVSTLPEGSPLTLDNNGDRKDVFVNDRGRAKAVWTGQSGLHTVFIVGCKDFADAVNCGT